MSVPPPVPQPYLHELVSCVQAPAVAVSGPDGQIRNGADGLFRNDRRALALLRVDVDGQAPVPVGHGQTDAHTAEFTSVVRHLGDPGADPTVWVERHRRVHERGVDERLTLVNAARHDLTATIRIAAATDFALMDAVKHGEQAPFASPILSGPDSAMWRDSAGRTVLRATGSPDREVDGERRLWLIWRVQVPARGRWSASLAITADPVTEATGSSFMAAGGNRWAAVTATGPPALTRLLDRGLSDLDALLLADPGQADDRFAAAGSPWYLTLFGRDSLWAARFLLPLGTELAAGTLRALARRQGRRHDLDTAEAPGKIPHEVRVNPQALAGGNLVYFGTVDATPLWVCLLHEAWRWGMPEPQVVALLDPLRRALQWLTDHADSDGDGFLEYVDRSGHGLVNQGWKDSGDSIQFADGTIAAGPIALCEAQAYAYQAATAGAALLAAFDQPGTERLQQWAEQLRTRFRETFWVSDKRGSFPAIALDGAKRPVAVASSNLGHLLATGLLTPAEAALVAARLGEPDLDCGYGLRTLSGDAAGFNPLSYHAGSVWPHDTAIAVQALSRDRFGGIARSLADGLLHAAPRFAHRLPELYAGTDARAGQPALAYPAACRPQAWSAAVPVPLLVAALGVEADVPGGTLTVQPRPEFAAWFPLQVAGMQVAGHPLSISVDASGAAEVATTAPLELRGQPPQPAVPQARPASDAITEVGSNATTAR